MPSYINLHYLDHYFKAQIYTLYYESILNLKNSNIFGGQFSVNIVFSTMYTWHTNVIIVIVVLMITFTCQFICHSDLSNRYVSDFSLNQSLPQSWKSTNVLFL